MDQLNLKAIGVQEMNTIELKQTNGGILSLIIAYGFQGALVASLIAGVYASYKQGYDSVQ